MKKDKEKEMVKCGNETGFSLVELMIVVVIIGILSTAFFTNFIAMEPTKNMHSFGRNLIAAVQMIRLEAVKRNTCMGLVFQPAAPPPADLTGLTNNNRGGYVVFIDDGGPGGGVNACNGTVDAGEIINSTNFVPAGVALTRSPVVTTGADNDSTDLFDGISFDSRALISNQVAPAGNRAIVLRNNTNPANVTWWGRVIVNSLGGSMEYQTNDNPANEGNWSE